MKNKKTSYIRLLHASPNAPAVDIYANDDVLLTEDLEFGEFSPYIPVQPGTYKIDIYPSGLTSNVVLTTSLNIPEKKILTIAAIGSPENLEAFVIDDKKQEIPNNKLGLRVVHLSPNAPAVDVVLPNGDILFKDINYKEVADYIFVPPDTYSVNIVPTGTDTVVLKIPNIKLTKDRFYSVYAVGLLNETPPLHVLIPLDGNTYINNV